MVGCWATFSISKVLTNGATQVCPRDRFWAAFSEPVHSSYAMGCGPSKKEPVFSINNDDSGNGGDNNKGSGNSGNDDST